MSLKFKVVLCRIRLFPTLVSKIKWLGSGLHLIYDPDLLQNLTSFLEFITTKPSNGNLMNLALSIIANLLTNESGKEKVSEQNIKFFVSMLEEIVASELYDQLDLVTKTSIMSRTIRALGNAASSNESNLAKIHKLRNVLKHIFTYLS